MLFSLKKIYEVFFWYKWCKNRINTLKYKREFKNPPKILMYGNCNNIAPKNIYTDYQGGIYKIMGIANMRSCFKPKAGWGQALFCSPL